MQAFVFAKAFPVKNARACAIIFEKINSPLAKGFIATENTEKKRISQGSLRALWLRGRY